MLYRHAHALLQVEGYENRNEFTGKTFQIRPADHDAVHAQQRFLLWSTLTTRSPLPGEPDSLPDPPPPPKPPAPESLQPDPAPKAIQLARAQLVVEVSADGRHWVALEPHDAQQPARVVRIPFLLPFVRARVVARGLHFEATAVLMGSDPFSLHAKARRDAVVIVGSA